MAYNVYQGYPVEDFDESVQEIPVHKEQAASVGQKVALASGDPSLADGISNDLAISGRSEDLISSVTSQRAQEDVLQAQVAGEIAQEVDPATGLAALESAQSDNDDVDSLEREAIYEFLARSNPDSLSSEDILDVLDKEKAISDETRNEYLNALAMEGGAGSLTFEFLEGVVPFVDAISVAKLERAIEKETGKNFESFAGAVFAPGKVMGAIEDWIAELPPQEQREVAKFVLEASKDAAGILTDNDWIRVGLIQDALNKSFVYEQDAVFDNRDLRNVISLLDIVALGGVVKSVARGGKVLTNGVQDTTKASNVARAERLDPKEGGAIRAESIADETGAAAAKAGTTREDSVAEAFLQRVDAQKNSPYIGKRAAEQQYRAAQRAVSREVDLSTHLKESEKIQQGLNSVRAMERVSKGTLYGNASDAYKLTDDGIDVTARFGLSSENGYSAIQAIEAAERITRNVPASAEVKVVGRLYDGEMTSEALQSIKDVKPVKAIQMLKSRYPQVAQEDIPLKSGKDYNAWRNALQTSQKPPLFHNLPKSIRDEALNPTPKDTEFFVDVKYRDNYRSGSHAEMDPEDVLLTGLKAAYLGDVSAGLDKFLSDSLLRSWDLSKATEGYLIDILNPLLKAKAKNRNAVVSLLEKGRLEEVTYSTDDIIGMLDTTGKSYSDKDMQQIIEGYISARNFFDTSHVLNNRALSAQLDADGFTSVVTNDQGFHAFTRSMTDDEIAAVRTAYDPESDAVITLTKEALEREVLNGTTFQKARSAVAKDSEASTVIMVRGSTSTAKRPDEVLKYRSGYVPRVYDTDYFVVTKPKKFSVDGAQVRPEAIQGTARMAVKHRGDIDDAIAEVQKQYPDLDVDYRRAKELNSDTRRYMELDIEQAYGGLYFSRRGEHLTDIHHGLNDLSDTADVVSGILRLAGTLGKRIELQPVIQLHKQRWMNQWGHLSGHKWPLEGKGINDLQLGVTDDVQKARAAWQYINQVESSMVSSEWWKNGMFRFGEWVEDKTGNASLGLWVRTKGKGRDPLSWMRGTTFMATIVFNPMRQLFIQSQQVLFLSGIDPARTAKSMQEAMPLILAKNAVRRSGDADTSAYAKAAGLSKAEFDDTLQGLEESGLVEAIDSHLLGKDALFELQREVASGAPWMLQKLQNGFSRFAGGVKSFGFDSGERFNIVATYSLARKLWKKNNPSKSPSTKQARAEIAANARQYALGMTQSGALGYQKGILSLATQFLSIQHKAFAAGIRWVPGIGTLGNKALTKQESFRIFLGQSLLYGTSGWGLTRMVDSVLTDNDVVITDPQQKHILYGGMYDLTMNALISSFGEDTDLQFANNIAAGSGWADSFGRIFTELGSADKSVLEMFLGPTVNVASRIGDALKTIGSLKGVYANDAEMTPEKAREVLLAVPKIASGVNNVLKGISGSRLQQWVNANGQHLGIQSNDTEQLMHAMFGISGYKQSAAYEVWKTQKEKEEWLQETAEEMYRQVLEEMRFTPLPEVNREAHATVQSQATTTLNAFRVSLAEQDWDQVLKRYNSIVAQRSGLQDDMLNEASQLFLRDSVGYEDIIKEMIKAGLDPAEAEKLLGKDVRTTFFGDE